MENDPPWTPWTAEDERSAILSMLHDMLEKPDAMDGLHTYDAIEHVARLISKGWQYRQVMDEASPDDSPARTLGT